MRKTTAIKIEINVPRIRKSVPPKQIELNIPYTNTTTMTKEERIQGFANFTFKCFLEPNIGDEKYFLYITETESKKGYRVFITTPKDEVRDLTGLFNTLHEKHTSNGLMFDTEDKRSASLIFFRNAQFSVANKELARTKKTLGKKDARLLAPNPILPKTRTATTVFDGLPERPQPQPSPAGGRTEAPASSHPLIVLP